jgi:PPOX class probable F420-dependent enzyme
MQSFLALSEGAHCSKVSTSERTQHMSTHQPDSPTPDGVRVPHHQEVPFQSLDPSTPAGQDTIRRLHEELFIWLITVDATGTPHTLPVAFLWDEAHATFLIYSASEADRDRLAHIRLNAKVGLHFNFDLSGRDSLILTGEASISVDDPPSDQLPAWREKYQALFSQMGMTLQQAAALAPVALRIRPLTMLVTSWVIRPVGDA